VVRLMVDREPTIGGHLTQSNGPVPSSSHGGVRSGSGSSGPPTGSSSGQRTSGAASISWLLSTKVGQAPRDGVVTGVIGQLLRIKWSTGEESTVIPGPGAVAVVGKVTKSSGKKAPALTKATKSAKKGTRKSAR
jgi:hypothetical protein